MKHKNILFFGKAGYIDTDDVANNWGNKHENQDKITKSNGTP